MGELHLDGIHALAYARERYAFEDDDYAVFMDILEANKWGDENCKYDYTVKTSKMF